MDYELTTISQLLGMIVLAGAQFLLTLHRPAWGAATILFLLPAYLLRIRFTPLPTNALEVMVYAFFAGYLFLLLKRRATLPQFRNPLFLGWSLFLAGATLSALVNGIGAEKEAQRILLGSWKANLFDPSLFLVALVGLLQKERERILALKGYLAGAVAVAAASLLLAVFQKLSLSVPFEAITYDDRLRGPYLSPNHLAMFLAPALVAMLVWKKSFVWYLRAPFLAALAGALLWTESLGGFLALLGGMTTGIFIDERRRRLLPYFGGSLLFLGIIFPLLFVQFSPKLLSEGERSSLASRIMIWKAAGETLQESWLFGIGPGGFQEHYLALQKNYPPYLEWAVPQPHNLVLSVWLQAGLLGLVGWVVLVVGVLRRASHRASAYTTTTAAAAVAMLVYGLVDTPFWKNDLTLIVLLLMVFLADVDSKRPLRKEKVTG